MSTTTRPGSLFGIAVCRPALLASLFMWIAGCAGHPPYRSTNPGAIPATDCKTPYENARWQDTAIDADNETKRIQRVIRAGLATEPKQAAPSLCWSNSAEWHPATQERPEYGLFSVEFDDQGWLADTVKGVIPPETELTLLMRSLEQMTREGHPLQVVIFVHGWHHSAAADDGNIISFRRLLEHTAIAERALCIERRMKPEFVDFRNSPAMCDDSESGGMPLWLKKRRVVGIYLGWRGDSIKGPGIENFSIWDRKLAAESVALGSVQEFFSRIHSFYQEHDCHTPNSIYRHSPDVKDCVDVRMLTVGHSFGGLITYRALAPRLMMGTVESAITGNAGGPETSATGSRSSQSYVAGFGDLTVLINPAFEATRFEPLAQAAVARSYVDPARSDRPAQLPILIVATSKGDWATGTFFPLFRKLTTPFERARGAERSPNIHTIGWEDRYKTHEIAVMTSDVCGTTNQMSFEERLAREKQRSDRWRDGNYADFNRETLELCDALMLSKTQTWGVSADGHSAPPPYMPFWIVRTSKSVIKNHNDFLNDHFVDFVRQVYYTILRDGDDKMDEMRSGPSR